MEQVLKNPMTVQRNYDLSRCNTVEYASVLDALFNSTPWRDLFIRRAKFFRIIANRVDTKAIREVDNIDTKAGKLLLASMVEFSLSRAKENSGRVVTLNEYLEDFVRTEEQFECYQDFSIRINSAEVIADILETMLDSAKNTLAKIDPSCVTQEFEGIKAALKALKNFTTLHHRMENEELTTMFCDFAEEVEDWLLPKAAIFYKQYQDKRENLISSGAMKGNKSKKRSDREWLEERLIDYFYVNLKLTKEEDKHRSALAINKAKEVVRNITDSEMPAAKDYISKLVAESERIRMAKDTILTLNRNLPENETSTKLLNLIFPDQKK